MKQYSFRFGKNKYVVEAETPEEAINKLETEHGLVIMPVKDNFKGEMQVRTGEYVYGKM